MLRREEGERNDGWIIDRRDHYRIRTIFDDIDQDDRSPCNCLSKGREMGGLQKILKPVKVADFFDHSIDSLWQLCRWASKSMGGPESFSDAANTLEAVAWRSSWARRFLNRVANCGWLS
jgi:hypothetical protein